MNLKELKALMKKLGIKFPTGVTEKSAKAKIKSHLEKQGLKDGVDLTDVEIEFLEELGFDFEEEEETASVETEGEEDEEEEDEEEEDDDDEDEEEEDEEEEEEKPAPKKSKSEKKTEKKPKTEKTEKPKSSKKERKAKMIKAVTDLINKSKNGCTRDEIVDHIKKEIPDFSSATVRTYLSDGKNEKYCSFEKLLVEDKEKRLSFKK